MAKSKLVKVNEKIAEGVTSGYKKIEEGVVGAYKKVEDKFVDQYLTKDGETVEEAKERLHAQQNREAVRGALHGNAAEESLRKAKEAGEAARKKAGL